jgi:ribosomal protein S7
MITKRLKYNLKKKSLIMRFARVIAGPRPMGERIIIEVLSHIKKEIHRNPVVVVDEVITKLSPSLKTTPKRVAGRVLALPTYCNIFRRQFSAMKFLIKAAKTIPNSRTENMAKKLAREIINNYKKKSTLSLTYKKELIKTLKDNRPFLRFKRLHKDKRKKKRKKKIIRLSGGMRKTVFYTSKR